MIEYPITVYPTPEDEGYFSVVPDLPGCTAPGRTPEEAVRDALTAQRLWLAAAHDRGWPVPAPTLHSAIREAS